MSSNNGDGDHSKKQLSGDPSIKEIEDILTKAKREIKEDMIERNKDMVRKP